MKCYSLLFFSLLLVNPIISLAEEQGRFRGTIDNKSYDVTVQCFNMQSEHFRFQSDDWAQEDTNEDGVVVTGVKSETKLVLFVRGDGKTFKIALDRFEKSENTIDYVGEVVRANVWGKRTYPLNFRVTCPVEESPIVNPTVSE